MDEGKPTEQSTSGIIITDEVRRLVEQIQVARSTLDRVLYGEGDFTSILRRSQELYDLKARLADAEGLAELSL